MSQESKRQEGDSQRGEREMDQRGKIERERERERESLRRKERKRERTTKMIW